MRGYNLSERGADGLRAFADVDLMSKIGAMTDEELRAIATRCDQATRGPWRSWVEGRDHMSGSNFISTAGEDIEVISTNLDDQDFVAVARQDIPLLLEEIARLRALFPPQSQQ